MSANPSDPGSFSDSDLMLQVASGREDALSELFDRYSGGLLSLATRIVGNVSDAEEVLQEVFLHAWSRAAGYDPARSSVTTWLALITRSRSIDRLRSRKVIDRTADAARQENRSAHESPQASRNVFLHQRRERIGAAMRHLPEEQRQVLELAYYSGMTQSEIAREANIPLGTVKTRTLLAMKKLRQALGAEIGELL
ncbi:MAG: sigma-70 family RNA polymerase sigma factor [Acidobacteriota bacterium]